MDFLPNPQSLSMTGLYQYVTTTFNQTITGLKTFTPKLVVGASFSGSTAGIDCVGELAVNSSTVNSIVANGNNDIISNTGHNQLTATTGYNTLTCNGAGSYNSITCGSSGGYIRLETQADDITLISTFNKLNLLGSTAIALSSFTTITETINTVLKYVVTSIDTTITNTTIYLQGAMYFIGNVVISGSLNATATSGNNGIATLAGSNTFIATGGYNYLKAFPSSAGLQANLIEATQGYNTITCTGATNYNELYAANGAINYIYNIGNNAKNYMLNYGTGSENHIGAYGLGSYNYLYVTNANTTGSNNIINDGSTAGAIANNIATNNGNNRIYNLSGNNNIESQNGNNTILSTNGSNTITASNGSGNTILATAGSNNITSTFGSNLLTAKSNYIQGNNGVGSVANQMTATTGWNYLYGDNGNGNFSNKIIAQSGANRLETLGTGIGSYNYINGDNPGAGNLANWIRAGTGNNVIEALVGQNQFKSSVNSFYGDGGFMKLIGTTHCYIEFYPQTSIRQGYIGFTSGGSTQMTVVAPSVYIYSNGGDTNIVSSSTVYVNASNGFRLSNRPFEWYMCNNGGNGITLAGNTIGTVLQAGGNFSTINSYGGAPGGSWNNITGTFTAPTDGMYMFQFNMFNNNVGVYGRDIQMISTALPAGFQYCVFNLAETGGEASYQWGQTLWMSASQTAYFKNPSAISLQLYYADGHTNLRITRVY